MKTHNVIEEYLGRQSWEIKENSNRSFSLQGLNMMVAESAMSEYWLDKVYPKDVSDAHRDGDMHIHDLGGLSNYCTGWDLAYLLKNGLCGINGNNSSKPANHFRTALMHVVNFLYTIQNECMGAVAFSNVDTLLAPFIRADGLTYDEIKQSVQEFVFNINVPTRQGNQTPFTNISLDLTIPEHLKKVPAIVGGKTCDFTYGDLQEEADLFNMAFAEIMLDGDADGRPFSFPIPTFNLTEDFDWENPVYNPIWEMTSKYGIPYFANFINSDMKPEDSRSMCCRLRIDLNGTLYRRGGGLFGSGVKTGCYSEDTEIMTDSGWKDIRKLSKEDTVFTRTVEGRTELHKPKEIFEYDWNGDMFHITGRSTDLLVTPNHRMLCVDSHNKNQHFVEAESLAEKKGRYIPRTSEWSGSDSEVFLLPGIASSWVAGNHNSKRTVVWEELEIDMSLWLKFFGVWIAEGSYDNNNIAQSHGYRVFITQKREHNRAKIREMLEEFPFNFTEYKDGFYISNKQLWSYMKQFGHALDKFVPKDIKSLGPEKLKTLLEWMVLGDGHIRKTTKQTTYYTGSKDLADDVQEIVSKVGMYSSITTRKPRKSIINGRVILSKNDQYVVYFNKSKTQKIVSKNVKKVKYSGKVYCCEVENNTVFVRRNGKTSWCGNSIGVVTINLPRIGYVADDEEEFLDILTGLMWKAHDSLEIKRKMLEDLSDEGLYPYSSFYLQDTKDMSGGYWTNHFSTIGLIGLNDAIYNMTGNSIMPEDSHAFAIRVLEHMREVLSSIQHATGNIYNLEASPAEGASFKLALKDLKKYPEIHFYNMEESDGSAPYYTNSSQLPATNGLDLFSALDHQNDLQALYTGGTVFHTFLGESSPDIESLKKLIKLIATNYKIPYFSITPTFSICVSHGYITGEHNLCPECGEKCEVYSRVVGFLRPLESFNDGKVSEFLERENYTIDGGLT